MVDEEKIRFIVIVERMIEAHPDWVGDTILAVQRGITSAFSKANQDKADLAYSFSWLVENTPEVTENEKERMQKGLAVLAEFFDGASLGEYVSRFLIKDEDNEIHCNT